MNRKQVETVRRDPYGTTVGPDGEELSLQTVDGWDYLFRKLRPTEPYQFVHKRRPDGSKSDNDIIPVAIDAYLSEQSIDVAGYRTLQTYNE